MGWREGGVEGGRGDAGSEERGLTALIVRPVRRARLQQFPYSDELRPILRSVECWYQSVVLVVGMPPYSPFLSGMQVLINPTIFASLDACTDNFTKLMAATRKLPRLHPLHNFAFRTGHQVPAVKADVTFTRRPAPAQLTRLQLGLAELRGFCWPTSCHACGYDLTLIARSPEGKDEHQNWEPRVHGPLLTLTGAPKATECMTMHDCVSHRFYLLPSCDEAKPGISSL